MPATRRTVRGRPAADPETEDKPEEVNDTADTEPPAPRSPLKPRLSPEKAVVGDDDLTYDEYDLSEECDITVVCKVCKSNFNSLEKFITHKKDVCKAKRKDSLGVKNVSSNAPDSPNKTGASGTKRKEPPTNEAGFDLFEGDFPNAASPPEPSRPLKTYASRKRPKRIANIVPQPQPEPELEFIDTTLHPLPKPSTKHLSELDMEDTEDEMDTEMEEEDEALNALVKVTEVDEEEMDIPVKFSYVAKEAPPPAPKPPTTTQQPPGSTTSTDTGNTYALVRVEQVEPFSNEPFPSINLSLPAIKNVKFMNMKIPSPPDDGEPGLGSRMKGGLPEEEANPTMTPDRDSALSYLQSLVVKTAGGSFAKLYMRKVVKFSHTIFKYAREDMEETEAVETDFVIADAGDDAGDDDEASKPNSQVPTSALPAERDMEQDSLYKTDTSTTEPMTPGADEDSDDVCSDDDETFEHDPSIYDHLRNDQLYSLQARQKGRLAKMDIRGRSDCDMVNLKCLRCDTVYSCLKTLTNHMGNQHADKKPFYPCIFCGNVYSQQKNVSRHMQKSHNKTKKFVEKLRGFVRCQAFTRIFTCPEIDMASLTDDTDPFLIKLREQRNMPLVTRYANMDDRELLSRYGRKIKFLGRPPGRPSRQNQKTIQLTCTLCNENFSLLKVLLKHMRNEHKLLPRQISRMRGKLMDKLHAFEAERRKELEREEVKRQMERRQETYSIHSSPGPIKRIAPKVPPPIVQQKPMLQTLVQSQPMSMYKCSNCEKLFTTMAAVAAHTCSPNIIQKLVNTGEIATEMDAQTISALSNSQLATMTVSESVAASPGNALETLAEISTNEGYNISTSGGTKVLQINSPLSTHSHTLSPSQSQQQVFSITADQLEQLKRGGNNVKYLVIK